METSLLIGTAVQIVEEISVECVYGRGPAEADHGAAGIDIENGREIGVALEVFGDCPLGFSAHGSPFAPRDVFRQAGPAESNGLVPLPNRVNPRARLRRLPAHD
jgi:hypothetical protein